MNKKLQKKVKDAYVEIVNHRELDLPTEAEIEEVMPLPEDLRKRIEEKAEREKKYVYIWGKRISKAVIIILAILVTGMTVYAMVKSRFIYRIFEKNTTISTIEEEMEKGEEYLNSIYYPKYTLDFKIVSNEQLDASVFTLYQNNQGETFTFLQQVIQTQYNYDNETDEESVVVDNVEAVCFSKHGETTLIWVQYGYLYELHAPEKYKEDLIKIAESLEKE